MKNAFQSSLLSGLLLAVLFCFFSGTTAEAQPSCGGVTVNTSCLDFPLETYTCIDGDFLAEDLTEPAGGNKLLPASQALTTPQFLLIKGTISFDLDYTFAPGSDIVFLSGGFIVTAGKLLELSGTHLHGCTKLWNGIEVMSGCALNVTQITVIEDAITGIFVHKLATLFVESTTFKGNVTSIYVGENGPTNLSVNGFFIDNCRILGNKTLIEPFPMPNNMLLHRPLTGIKIEGITAITIGSKPNANPGPNPVIKMNIIRDFENDGANPTVVGIDIVRSNVTVQNTSFVRIANPSSFNGAGNGIRAFGIPIISDTKLTVLAPAFFTDCHTGINLLTHSAFVNGANFSGSHWGIFELAGQSVGFEISNCTFHRIVSSGIVFSTSSGVIAKKMIVRNNSFVADNQEIFGQDAHFGVDISTETQFTSNSYLIENNSFVNSIPGISNLNRTFKAISVNKIGGIKINGNSILDLNLSSDGRRWSGIDVKASPNSQIQLNTLNGGVLNYLENALGFPPAAISLKESNNCLVNCNTTNNVNRGISFDGMACDATDLRNNEMHTHNQGLYLENNTIVGDQLEKDNVWFGSANQTEGFFNFIGYNPNNQTHVDFVGMSKFLISTFDESSSRWANPRIVGGNNDSGHNWFIGNNESIKQTICFSTPGDLTQSEIEAIAGQWPPLHGYASTPWEASLHAFGRIHQYPELRPANSSAENWYNSNYSSNLGVLARSYQTATRLGQQTSAMEAVSALLNGLLAEASSKNEEWATATSTNAQNALLQEIDALNTSILAAMSNLSNLTAANIADKNAAIQAILADLNALNLTTAYEQDFSTVLKISLDAALASQSFSENQKQQLETIAAKCRIAGGYGVVLARSSLNKLEQSFSADANCTNSPTPLIAQNSSIISGVLWPNPTTGTINLQWEKIQQSCSLMLIDIVGRPVKKWIVTESDRFQENINDLPVGVYFLEVHTDGQQTQTHRLLVSR